MALAVLVGSSLGVPGAALAQVGPHGPELMGLDHGHLMMLMRVAQLTDDQKAQAKQIMKQAHEATRPLVKQIRALHEQLTEKLVGSGNVQLSDLAPLRQQIRDLQIQVDDQAIGSLIKVRALLSPSQLQRVLDVHQKAKALHDQLDQLIGPPDDGPEGEGGH